jgi:hypothetical protein
MTQLQTKSLPKSSKKGYGSKITVLPMKIMMITKERERKSFILLTSSTALHFTTTRSPLAVSSIQILLISQHALEPIMIGMKQAQLTDHRVY